ncbi:MAG: putative diguanylate cyclase [Xanthobacteraceae bacterium]|nr:putative diguanylate cyclase [Xanthobacteraceae bacterium]
MDPRTARNAPVGLRARLLWALLIGLCLFLAERVLTVNRYQGELLAAAQERALDLALRGQAAFDQDVASAKVTLTMLAEHDKQLFDKSSCDRLLEATVAAAANILHLTVTNTDGVVTCSTLTRSVGEKYLDRAHIRVPLQSSTWHISDLVLGRVLQEPTVFVALPLIDAAGDTSGLLLARLNLIWLSTFIANNDRLGETSTILVDSTGEYAAEFPPDDAPAAQILVHDVARVVLSRSEGAAELEDSNGRGVLVGYTRLSLNNAHLAVLLDKNAALASTNRALYDSLIAFAAICALVGAGVAFGGSRYIVHPIERLVASLAAVGQGKPLPTGTLATGVKELQPLEHAIDEMAQRLADRERELRKANGHLEALAAIDPLTQIANRRAFDTYFETVWRNALETRATIGLIILDVDHFKSFNDIYGHVAGDQCLRDIAAALSHEVRFERDLVARLGGEEFVVLLPDCVPAYAKSVAYRLRRAVEALSIPHAPTALGIITISVGFTSHAPTSGDPPGMLLGNADRALYRAKRAGRNKVHGDEGEAA